MMPSAWKLIDLRIKSKIFNKFRSQLDIIVSKAHKRGICIMKIKNAIILCAGFGKRIETTNKNTKTSNKN